MAHNLQLDCLESLISIRNDVVFQQVFAMNLVFYKMTDVIEENNYFLADFSF